MFNRLLVPLDGSAQSAAALPLARTLARATSAAVTLLRVVPDQDSAPEATASLKRMADELARSEIQVESVVAHGEPADGIVQQINAQAADLVIMRAHGRAGLGRAVLGSVVDRVLANSPVPVLTLRAGGRRVSQVRTLLVPVDGSPGGALALSAATGLARATGAALRLVQVVVPIPASVYAALLQSGGGSIDPVWDQDAEGAAQAYVQALVVRLRGAGLRVDGQVRVAPSVADAIVVTADEEEADLIVMSTRALVGPARALLGSVADAVVRTAQCPVMLVHRELTGNSMPPTSSESGPATPVTRG